MAIARKSGNNPPNPNVAKSNWLARKPVRRRAPLRVKNSLASPVNQAFLDKDVTAHGHAAATKTMLVDNSSINSATNYAQGSSQTALSAPKHRRSPSNKHSKSHVLKQPKTNKQGNGQTHPNPIPVMPGSEVIPFWLKKIQQVQRYTSILTFALVSATLAVYALNVYSQQSWGMAYKELQRLQKNEQQLTTKNEVLKNKIAGEAEKPATGLMTPSPQEAIFITPATSSPSQVETVNPQPPLPQPTNGNINTNPVMGY